MTSVPREVVVRMARKVGEGLTAHRATNGESRSDADVADQLIRTQLEAAAAASTAAGHTPLPPAAEQALAHAVRAELFMAGPMQQWLDDESISDIHIIGYDVIWLKHRDGRRVRVASPFRTERELHDWIVGQARRQSRIEQRFDYGSPLLDMRMADGSRLNASEWVSARPSVVIRRHDWAISRLDDLVARNTCTAHVAQLLGAMVRSGRNILVSGGTGTGKTTLLRCLLNEVPEWVRIITIEDNFELGLSRWPELHGNVVEMEARPPNLEGAGEISLRTLVRNALRQDPDRIVVGESRGAECIDLLTAMSTNQAGSMASIHADSSAAALRRLQTYAAAFGDPPIPPDYSKELIRDAVHFVVHLGWVDGDRRITSVREVDRNMRDGGLHSNEVFELGPDGHAVPAFGISDRSHVEALAANGFDPGSMGPGRLA